MIESWSDYEQPQYFYSLRARIGSIGNWILNTKSCHKPVFNREGGEFLVVHGWATDGLMQTVVYILHVVPVVRVKTIEVDLDLQGILRCLVSPPLSVSLVYSPVPPSPTVSSSGADGLLVGSVRDARCTRGSLCSAFFALPTRRLFLFAFLDGLWFTRAFVFILFAR